MLVHLVRHGESVSNAGLPSHTKPGENWFDYPLTDKGWQQAREVSLKLRHPIDLIVTSKYLRAKQTAAPLIEVNKGTSVEVWPVEEFTYLDPSHYEGTTYKDREEARARYWTRGDPHFQDGSLSESFAHLIRRVDELAIKLINYPKFVANENGIERIGPSIVIFSHGQFTRALLWRHMFGCLPLTPQTMTHFRQFDLSMEIPNTAILPIRSESGRLLVGGFDACVAQLAEH